MINAVDVAFDLASAESGIRGGSDLRICTKSKPARSRPWTKEEDDFLRTNLGHLPEDEIAKKLHRTPQAVHLRWERNLHLRAPSKRDDILTAEQVSLGLCKDSKSIHLLIDRGIMQGRRMPMRGRKIRIVDRRYLVKWLLDPLNWVYIKPERVGELRPHGKRSISPDYDFAFWEEASRLVLEARRRWDDEWITPGWIARILHLPARSRYVNAAIKRGALPATRWGNWWIRRSAMPAGMTLTFRGEWISKLDPGLQLET